MLVVLHKVVVVTLLDDQQNNLHEVEETQVLVCFLVGQKNELHDVFDVVLVSDLLDVLEVPKYLDQFVPDGVGKVPCVLDFIDFQEANCDIFVDLVQVLGNQKFDDEDVLFHVPATSLVVEIEVLPARIDQPL